MRIKGKRRVKGALRLPVTYGAWVEESRKGPKLVFRAEDVIAGEELYEYLRLVCIIASEFFGLAGKWYCGVCLAHDGLVSHRLDVHFIVPISEKFCMSFAELAYHAPGFLRRRRLEPERILSWIGCQDGVSDAMLLVRYVCQTFSAIYCI